MQARMYALVVGCLLVASTAWAADVDGRWTGSLATPMGDVPISFVFKTDGTKLTGHMVGVLTGPMNRLPASPWGRSYEPSWSR